MRGHGKWQVTSTEGGTHSCASGRSKRTLISSGAGALTPTKEAELWTGTLLTITSSQVLLCAQFSENIIYGRWES